MLTEEQITAKKLPILRRLDELNNYIASVFAKGITEGSTQEEYAKDLKKINKRIQDTAIADVDELYGLLFLIALSMYKDSKDFYEYNKIPYTSMANNKPVMAIINSYSSDFVDRHIDKLKLENMYIKPDRGNMVKAETWYKKAISSKNPQRELNTLTGSGIRIKTDTGNTSRLDTDFENDIDNSIKDLSQSIQDEIGKQFGSDGKELSVHAFPAPDHAPVQGHVFYNEEYDKMQNAEDFQDVDGNSFIGFERAIGMWNCRHFAFSIVVGVHPRNYTQEQLDNILANNKKGYTHKGKHFTMYDCTQLQRRYEREIRKAKDGYIVSKAGNDRELMDKYRNRVNKYMNEYKAFSKGCGLRVKYNRIYVEGYK